MESLYQVVATVGTAVGLFIGANIDDMVALAVLNATSRTEGRPTPRQIWAGQYAGIAILVVISLLAALGLTLVPEQWVWLLGLLPLSLPSASRSGAGSGPGWSRTDR